MKAEERTISKILTEQACYEVPPYQRPYSWEKENVQQLLEDIWEAFEAKDSEYFMGSLITIEKERDLRYDVVDGQQRLTTLNLVFARLRDHITDDAAKAELGKRILPRNVLTDEAQTPRLLLRRKDQGFFRKNVLESATIDSKSRGQLEAPQRHIVENLEVVDGFFVGKSQQVLKLLANYILSKVYVVFVTTSSMQSAYRLFNVLNARGMSLSNADLIKNSLFALLGPQDNRSGDLEDRWLELESEVGIDQLDSFFGHYRTSIVAAKARGSLQEEIEPIIHSTVGGPFQFLDSANKAAENYVRVVDGELTDPGSLQYIRALRRVEYDEWIPPLLAFLNTPVPGLAESEFVSLLERITMQNWVRRLGRTARLTVYYQLINAVREGRSAKEIRDIFRKNSQNTEFLTLLGSELYGKPFDAAVLLRLEEAGQDESVMRTYSGQITIEHVLPQALKEEYWKARFNEGQHALWLHRLGNLALLSGRKNYKAQYFGFERKKAIYTEKNKKVSFDLTKEVCAEPDWTLDVVERRHERLMALAGRTWAIA
jgi:hypothetical protein